MSAVPSLLWGRDGAHAFMRLCAHLRWRPLCVGCVLSVACIVAGALACGGERLLSRVAECLACVFGVCLHGVARVLTSGVSYVGAWRVVGVLLPLCGVCVAAFVGWLRFCATVVVV